MHLTPIAAIRSKSVPRSRQIDPRPLTGPLRRTFLPGQDESRRLPIVGAAKWGRVGMVNGGLTLSFVEVEGEVE